MELQQEGAVIAYSITDAQITRLEEEFAEVPQDLSVKANYEICRKATSTIRGLRGDVEKRRKELKADALEYGKKVDSAAKEITARLLAIEEPFAIAKKDYDTAEEIAKREAALAEERRVDGIADRIASIKAKVERAISATAPQIKDMMAEISVNDLPATWADEFTDKATTVITETMRKLDELLVMKIQQDEMAKQQAEFEAKKKAEDEQRRIEEDLARKQREEEIARERKEIEEERRKMVAEQAAIDAENRIEREKIAKVQAEIARVEREKVEDEKAVLDAANSNIKTMLAAEEAAKEAKEISSVMIMREDAIVGEHQYKAAGKAIMAITGSKQMAKTLLDSIIGGSIPHIYFGD